MLMALFQSLVITNYGNFQFVSKVIRDCFDFTSFAL